LSLVPSRAALLAATGLVFLWALSVAGARRAAFPGVAWPDECIYIVGARNLVERGSLQTNFYLTYSLVRRGHPHRDVHMPGYLLALAPFVRALGPTLAAAATLNAVLFLACVALVHAIARALLESREQALAAAALFAVLPPFPGYLQVAYPELVVAFVFLAGIAWLVRGGGTSHAAVAGLLFGLGALFRETLLLALPIYALRIPRRELLRAFAPAAAATLLLVVAPLARERAIHPNAIYPGLVEEARRSEAPLATFVSALARNVEENLRLGAALDPVASAEDAALAFLALLAAVAALGAAGLPAPARRFALGTFLSLGLLSAAVLTLYVVRVRGGVWGGVRAYMAWAPLLLVFAVAAARRLRQRKARLALVAAAFALFVQLDLRQAAFFRRYKQTDHEDQDRNARYLARYLDAAAPVRIVSRSFLYGLTHYPVEVVWSLPRDHVELQALERAVAFEFLALHEKSALRLALVQNPRYLRVNKDDRGAEFLIWRRLY
jgi:hypothetical protein